MPKILLSIIIVTFNSEKYIEKCISSIFKSAVEKNILINVIIVDNGSGVLGIKKNREIKSKYTSVSIIENKLNKGFAKAVNIGIKRARVADLYLILNPDTIIQKRSISELIKCFDITKAGIVGGSTYNFNGEESGSYFRFPNLMVGLFDFTNLRRLLINDYWHKYFYYLDTDYSKKEYFPVDIVTGGFMMISKKAINTIGSFDERFFMYLEDVDYCLRANFLNIKIYHCNKSKISHYGGGSSPNKDRIRYTSWLWSRKLYFFKHFGFLSNFIIQPIFLIDDLLILTKKYFF